MDQNVYEGPERRREQEAYEAGRRQASTDADIASHERRLNAINGSIERAARHSRDLADAIEALSDKVDGLINGRHTEKLISNALREEVAKNHNEMKEARESQVTTRMFLVGVATVVVMLLGLIATIATSGVVIGHP